MRNNIRAIKIYKARTIGILFLMAFIAYGLGRHFFESSIAHETYLGVFLIITNTIIVLFIGILLRKTLKQYNLLVGNIYLWTRLFEAAALSSIVLNLIPAVEIQYDYGYFIAMLVLGVGSVPMCFALFKHKISSPFIALWGMIGYAILAFGFLMEFFDKEWSTYFLIPGGLWEITFGLWLIIKGRKIETDKQAIDSNILGSGDSVIK